MLRVLVSQASTLGLVRELERRGEAAGARVLCPVPRVTGKGVHGAGEEAAWVGSIYHPSTNWDPDVRVSVRGPLQSSQVFKCPRISFSVRSRSGKVR